VDRLSELLGQAVQFAYTCWDRIVLNGYIERLQRPENLVYFFHDVVGVACIEPALLEQRTNAYKAWVRRITDEQGIPVLSAPPKGVQLTGLGRSHSLLAGMLGPKDRPQSFDSPSESSQPEGRACRVGLDGAKPRVARQVRERGAHGG